MHNFDIHDISQMLGLIGRQVRYLDETYEIADLLPEEGVLVLIAETVDALQEDSYGRPHRLVPRQLSLRYRDATGVPTGIHLELHLLDG